LSATGLKWDQVIPLFLKSPVNFIESSDLTKQVSGEINDDNVGLVFACNVLGHYFMVRELEPLLKASGAGRIIWTSSGTAASETFSIDDWQGIKAYVMEINVEWHFNEFTLISCCFAAPEQSLMNHQNGLPILLASI
jgi:17beta-estradiol 17-dehydrogenase/3beta-hydroxysteroid 3-dehydrogenase